MPSGCNEVAPGFSEIISTPPLPPRTRAQDSPKEDVALQEDNLWKPYKGKLYKSKPNLITKLCVPRTRARDAVPVPVPVPPWSRIEHLSALLQYSRYERRGQENN